MTRTARVHGLDVNIRIEGSGQPLLLINGLARPLDSWATFSRALTNRTVISYDAPGTGESLTPMFPLSMAALADVAVRVLDEVGVDSADVVGFSHGGAIAQQLAVDAPHRIRRLVLAATSCGVGAVGGAIGDLGRGMLKPAEGAGWRVPDPMGVLWQILAITTWSSIPDLANIDIPTLVVCGSHDRIVPPANSEMLAARIPNARLAMIDAGHDLQRGESAREFATLVQEFLESKEDNDAKSNVR
jgi:poly(3-hydroxyoctanoate) depolymerase